MPDRMTQVERIAALNEIAGALRTLGMHEPARTLGRVVEGLSSGPATLEEARAWARDQVERAVAGTTRPLVGRTPESARMTQAMNEAIRERVRAAEARPVIVRRRGRGYDVPHPANGYRVVRLSTGTSAFRVWCPFCRDFILAADVETHVAGYHGETKLAVVPAADVMGER